MKKSILNLEGVQVLSRNEQKDVNGGKGSYCKMVMYYSNGSAEVGGGYFESSTWSGVSSAAGAECAKAMAEMGGTRCTYDCAYDGYGQ